MLHTRPGATSSVLVTFFFTVVIDNAVCLYSGSVVSGRWGPGVYATKPSDEAIAEMISQWACCSHALLFRVIRCFLHQPLSPGSQVCLGFYSTSWIYG